MKKYLLPQGGNYYKANLHCHSTFSDGAYSPRELKEKYMEQGYSIIAYSDHNILACHHDELSDGDFLALNAMEFNICQTNADKTPMDFNLKKSAHFGLIAKDPRNVKNPFFAKEFLTKQSKIQGFEPKFHENDPEFEREYTKECINRAIQQAKDRGFFVIYNHPTWSLEGYNDYSAYEGFDAIEMFNYHNYVRGFPEYNPRVFDDLLRQNKRVTCVSTDDNHNTRLADSFGGFTMIKAEELSYESIIKALEDGNFYASCGPIIRALWYEDKKICIECEPCKRIQFSTAITLAYSVRAKEGEELTYAEFPVDPSYGYVRITLTGEKGRKANTNAYFLEELMKEDASL